MVSPVMFRAITECRGKFHGGFVWRTGCLVRLWRASALCSFIRLRLFVPPFVVLYAMIPFLTAYGHQVYVDR